jgi:hypothetical protein
MVPKGLEPFPKLSERVPELSEPFLKPLEVFPKSLEPFLKPLEVSPKSLEVFLKPLEVFPKSLEVFPKSLEVFPKSLEVFPKSLEVFLKLSERVPEVAETILKLLERVPELAKTVLEHADVTAKQRAHTPQMRGRLRRYAGNSQWEQNPSAARRRKGVSMGQYGDWIPHGEHGLLDLMNRWYEWMLITGKITAFGWDAAFCAKVVFAIEAFFTARSEYEINKTPENRLTKDEKKEDAVDLMRDFANAAIRFNQKMTDADKLYMGIHQTDTTHTTHPAPTSQPDTDVIPTRNHYEHLLRAMNHTTGGTSKPADAYGVRYAWQVAGEKPASGEDLAKSKFTRKTSLVVSHGEADKGKTAYYATCYENSKGDQGTWSPVIEAIIA